jgi:hypothetical protein
MIDRELLLRVGRDRVAVQQPFNPWRAPRNPVERYDRCYNLPLRKSELPSENLQIGD